MDLGKIRTPDDFEKLSDAEKQVFKNTCQEAYKEMFKMNMQPAKLDWRDNVKELNFYPSDIKTPDDFEALTDSGKLYLKEQFPLVYKEIFKRAG